MKFKTKVLSVLFSLVMLIVVLYCSSLGPRIFLYIASGDAQISGVSGSFASGHITVDTADIYVDGYHIQAGGIQMDGVSLFNKSLHLLGLEFLKVELDEQADQKPTEAMMWHVEQIDVKYLSLSVSTSGKMKLLKNINCYHTPDGHKVDLESKGIRHTQLKLIDLLG